MKDFGGKIVDSAKSSFADAKENITKGISATSNIASRASDSIASGAKQTVEFASNTAIQVGNSSVVAGERIADSAKSTFSDAKENIARGISATGNFAGKTSDSISSGAKHAIEFASDAAKQVGSTSMVVGAVTKQSVSTVATTLFDKNGDGKLDQEDLKIFTEKGIEASKVAGKAMLEAVKTVSSSELVKSSAGAALVGAAIAIPVPLVGPAAGAAVGAAFGVYSNLTKKK